MTAKVRIRRHRRGVRTKLRSRGRGVREHKRIAGRTGSIQAKKRGTLRKKKPSVVRRFLDELASEYAKLTPAEQRKALAAGWAVVAEAKKRALTLIESRRKK